MSRGQQAGWGAATLLVVLTVAAYLPAFQAGFIWDDDDNVTGNVTLGSMDGLTRIWADPAAVPPWYPLAHSALWLEYRLWGPSPAGYHAVNVALHALNAVLVWVLFRRLRVPGALLGAALFALHPLQVESVAWITEQKNLLSTSFALASLLAWLRYRPELVSATDPSPPTGFLPRPTLAWFVSLFAFALALLTKTAVVALPVVLLAITWWKIGRVSRRDVIAVTPFLLAAIALGGLTAWLERHAVGASGPEWDRSLLERTTIAARGLWFYGAKFVWPWPPTYVYPRFAAVSIWGYVATLAAVGLPLLLWQRRAQWGRGPLTAVACFGLVVAPALGFLDIYYMRYTFVADRWVYQASIAALALLAAVGTTTAARTALPRPASLALGGLVLTALGISTFTYSRAFVDEKTLWLDTLRKNPSAIVAHNNLGGLLLAEGDTAGARGQFLAAIEVNPDWPETHNNLGAVLFREGDPRGAEAAHRRAIELQPDFADAHNNLAIALATLGRNDEAIDHFRRAIELHPTMANARFNLGLTLLVVREDLAGAAEQLGQAARIAPNDPQTRATLGLALARSDRYAEAAAEYRAALTLSPGDSQTRLRLAWLQATCDDAITRDGASAVAAAEPLVERLGDGQPALEILAAAYAEAGRFAEAQLTVAHAANGRLPPETIRRLDQQMATYREGRAWRTPRQCPRCWP